MTQAFAIADVGSLLGDPSRAAMLVELMDGRSRSAGELARCARITPAAASMHLGKLLQGQLLSVEKQGRHRYYRLASAKVGEALEALGLIATVPAPRSKALSPQQAALRHTRTCYDHLAGTVAVQLREALEREGVVTSAGERDYRVTRTGVVWLRANFDVDVDELTRMRRATARKCLDWTERRPHVAGALGASLLAHMRSQKWLVPMRQSRALRITDRGLNELRRLGIQSLDLKET